VKRILKRLFGVNGRKINRGVDRIVYKEIHNLYSSPNVIMMIESIEENETEKKIHVLKRMKIFSEIMNGADNLEDLDIDMALLLNGS
jgi:hypothetical protein